MKRITDLPIGMKVEVQSGHDKRLSGVIAKAPAWAAMRQGEMIPVETEEGVRLYAPQTIFVESFEVKSLREALRIAREYVVASELRQSKVDLSVIDAALKDPS